jgi:hypothetical protein
MRRRYLVNPGGGRQLRTNRMQRPTEAYRRKDPARWSRDWGTVGVKEAQKIFDTGMSKGAPSWLRPPGAREKLPAPYGREQARREYQAAIRGNPGVGRRFTFHGAFGTKAAAQAKERAVGGFIRSTTIGGRRRYLVLTRKQSPRGRRGKSAHHPAHLEARTMARRRSKSRRRSSARRHRRRAVARVTLSSNPRRHRRRHTAARTHHRGRRRSFRRNPPGGIFGRLLTALGNGLTVSGGQIVQNSVVRYVPDLIPATVPQAGILNGALKDVAGILAGAWGAHMVLGAKRAEFFVAGQASAAINRVVRAANIPTVSTLLGEYDPIRLGSYVTGTTRARAAIAAAAANGGGATPGNVRALKNVGVYTDGVSFSPSLY